MVKETQQTVCAATILIDDVYKPYNNLTEQMNFIIIMFRYIALSAVCNAYTMLKKNEWNKKLWTFIDLLIRRHAA